MEYIKSVLRNLYEIVYLYTSKKQRVTRCLIYALFGFVRPPEMTMRHISDVPSATVSI